MDLLRFFLLARLAAHGPDTRRVGAAAPDLQPARPTGQGAAPSPFTFAGNGWCCISIRKMTRPDGTPPKPAVFVTGRRSLAELGVQVVGVGASTIPCPIALSPRSTNFPFPCSLIRMAAWPRAMAPCQTGNSSSSPSARPSSSTRKGVVRKKLSECGCRIHACLLRKCCAVHLPGRPVSSVSMPRHSKNVAPASPGTAGEIDIVEPFDPHTAFARGGVHKLAVPQVNAHVRIGLTIGIEEHQVGGASVRCGRLAA